MTGVHFWDSSSIDSADNDAQPPASNFQDLDIPAELLRSLYADFKLIKPTLLQRQVLPMMMTAPHQSMIVEVSEQADVESGSSCNLLTA